MLTFIVFHKQNYSKSMHFTEIAYIHTYIYIKLNKFRLAKVCIWIFVLYIITYYTLLFAVTIHLGTYLYYCIRRNYLKRFNVSEKKEERKCERKNNLTSVTVMYVHMYVFYFIHIMCFNFEYHHFHEGIGTILSHLDFRYAETNIFVAFT